MMKTIHIILFVLTLILPLTLISQESVLNESNREILVMRAQYASMIFEMKNFISTIIPTNEEEPDNTSVELEDPAELNETVLDYKPVGWPVKEYKSTSSDYGYRKDPFTKKRAFHGGVDIPIPVNTPVCATAPGIIDRLGYDKRSGNYVVVSHGASYETIYAHLNRVSVVVGDSVTNETIIGYSGNTGRTTAPHLHYQINDKKNNSTINPRKLFINH